MENPVQSWITLQEASSILGVSLSSLRKKAQRGILSSATKKKTLGGLQWVIDISEFEKLKEENLFQTHYVCKEDSEKQESVETSPENVNNLKPEFDSNILREHIDEAVERSIVKIMENTRNQLMKPLEQQAIYQLGKAEKEIEHLRAEKDLLLQEIEKYKMLPPPSQELEEKFREKEEQLSKTEKLREEEKLKLNEMAEKLNLQEKTAENLKKELEEEKRVKEQYKTAYENEAGKSWWKKLFGK
jgi:hypothetical protein